MTTTGIPVVGGRAQGAIEVKAAPSALGDAACGYPGGVTAQEWFEGVYRAAAGDAATIPWAGGRPDAAMVAWLNTEAFGLVRPGSRVAVVGCGLGDDAAELACRGYDVVGFDVSGTAVEWARRRFPHLGASLVQADLLALPTRLLRRFDLVVEAYTLQSLPPARRAEAARAVASLACSKGHVLAICGGRGEDEPLAGLAGPPWPLTASELEGLMEGAGMRPARPVEDSLDGGRPPARRLRGLFSR